MFSVPLENRFYCYFNHAQVSSRVRLVLDDRRLVWLRAHARTCVNGYVYYIVAGMLARLMTKPSTSTP